jgi:hypothetical protein
VLAGQAGVQAGVAGPFQEKFIGFSPKLDFKEDIALVS